MENNCSTDQNFLSNKKRIYSLHLKEKQYKTQQQQIKSALANIDFKTPSNKKILFESDDENESKQISKRQPKKINLFDDSDNDETDKIKEENLIDVFHVRSQFEGKQGQKLLELQSHFKNDERFHLDERFLESDEDDDDKLDKKGDEEMNAIDISEERKRNLEILQDVVGVHIETIEKKSNQGYKDMNSLRYDPKKEDARKFEIKHNLKQMDSSKKSKKKNKAELTSIVLPEVSKDQYFQISSDLKTTFNTSNQDFCFLSQHDKEKSGLNDDVYNVKHIFSPKIKNFLEYDSSGEDEAKEATQKSEGFEKQLQKMKEKCDWKFFFIDDDPRLQEGIKFFQRTETDEEISSWWLETRPKMLNIIHSKVKNFNNKVNKRRRKEK